MAEQLLTRWIDPQAVARLMAQPVVARFPMEGSVSGMHKSPHRGSSVEFAEYRNYEPGDDIRRLDWRVYARTDRFYLKEFEAETNLRCYLVLDSSASMGFAGKEGRKIDFARRLAATLAYLIVRQGDAAGLVGAAEGTVVEVPPRRSPSHLQLILQGLDKAEPRGKSGLVQVLHDLAEKAGRRALIVVVSDFFYEIEPLMSCFQHLRFQKHDVVAFQLLDRMELEFDFSQPTRFLDMESQTSLVTEPTLIREQYLEQLQQFLSNVRAAAQQFQIDYRQVVTDENYESVLAGFLAERAQFAAMTSR